MLNCDDQFSEDMNIQRYLHMKYMDQAHRNATHLLSDLGQISEQNELLRDIRQTIEKKMQDQQQQNTFNDLPTKSFIEDNETLESSRSELFESRAYLKTEIYEVPTSRKRVFLTPVQQLQRALSQIQQKCSRRTCEAISRLLSENDTKSQSIKHKEMEISKLQTEMAILKQRYEQQGKKITVLDQKLKTMQAQISAKSKNFADKQKQLVKLQTSLVVKERFLGDETKKLATRANQQASEEKRIRSEREEVDRLWLQLLKKVQETYSDNGTFRKTVFEKCKESLIKQRNLVTEQRESLDKEADSINRIIMQLKGHNL